jgi:hypothetical protein
MFFTKKFQGIVFSIDCDVLQGWEYTTICVFTIKFLFVGMWVSFDKKTLLFPRLSKYKAGGIIGESYFKDDSILKSEWDEKGRDLRSRSISER